MPQAVVCVALGPSSEALTHYAEALGVSLDRAADALARALSLSLADSLRSRPAVLVLRQRRVPALALWGRFDEVELAGYEMQARALEHGCAHMRYLTPPEVESACERLAERLREHLGRDLEQASVSAIPRGGSQVLSRLAKRLGFSKPLRDDSRLLILVDDCAISGMRFRQALDRSDHDRVIFAPLFSPAGLREAIHAQEPRVEACLSAGDLRELPETPADDHVERRRARIRRGECYWLGATENLCFPWNEPDRTLWNPTAERYERAWKILPPEMCTKNCPMPGAQPVAIQVQPVGRGPLRPADQTLFADFEGAIVVCSLADSRLLRLEGLGSDLWREIVLHGSLEGALGSLTGEYDVSAATLEADARRFTRDLLEQGLLTSSQ